MEMNCHTCASGTCAYIEVVSLWPKLKLCFSFLLFSGQIEDRRTVAFTAVISQIDIRNLGAGQSIVFDRILTNIRGAYHSTTGIFTTPVSGIYAFNVALMVNPGDREYLDIVKDGIAVMPIYCHTAGAQHYISPSRTVTLALNKGNEVWIRTSTSQNHGTGQIHGNGYTTFSGWLIDYTD